MKKGKMGETSKALRQVRASATSVTLFPSLSISVLDTTDPFLSSHVQASLNTICLPQCLHILVKAVFSWARLIPRWLKINGLQSHCFHCHGDNGTPVGDIFQSFLPFGEGQDGFRPLHLTYLEREAEKSSSVASNEIIGQKQQKVVNDLVLSYHR